MELIEIIQDRGLDIEQLTVYDLIDIYDELEVDDDYEDEDDYIEI